MPTQEERITLLEHITKEYKPVLKEFAYETTMVKGLILEQTIITQELKRDTTELRRDMDELRQGMGDVKTRLARIEEQLRQILTLLKPS